MNRILRAGTKIICPECKKELLELARDIFECERISETMFKPQPIIGAPMICPDDGASYFRQAKDQPAQLHTQKGWQ